MSEVDRASALAALGIQTESEVKTNAHARMLVLGAPKSGKTTALLETAPAPMLVNADGASAAKFALKRGATMAQVDCYTSAQFKEAYVKAEKAVKAGLVKTVIVDSVTMLAERLLQEFDVKYGEDKFKLFSAYGKALTGGLSKFLQLPCHVILVGHLSAKDDSEAGVLPHVAGQSKTKIPAAVDDWVILTYEQGRKPHERTFLVGAQKGWYAGCRNAKRTCEIEADVKVLFSELGLQI